MKTKYMELDQKCSAEFYKAGSQRQFETTVFVPTARRMEDRKASLEALAEEVSRLPEPSAGYSVIKQRLQEVAETLSLDRPALASPIALLGGFISTLFSKDSRSSQERAEVLFKRFQAAEPMWAEIFRELSGDGVSNAAQIALACEGLSKSALGAISKVPGDLAGLSAAGTKQVEVSLKELSETASIWAEKARALMASANLKESSVVPEVPQDSDYAQVLEKRIGVNLDELLSWYEDEIEKTRSAVFDYCGTLDLGKTPQPKTMDEVVAILEKRAGPCDTVEEMVTRLEHYMARAKSAAKQYVNLPEETCRVIPVPESCRYTHPWGGYAGGCFRRRPLIGEVFLNNYNFKAITDGWIKVNAVHECYPGHHVQFVRSTLDPIPETFKIQVRSVPVIEGTAHRSERLFEFIFEEDPFYPLFVAYRRHHTSVRIKADLWLRHFKKSVDDVVDLYVKEMGFDRNTARIQVRAQERRMGYHTAYYYGLKQILDLEAESGYGDKEFTEFIFSFSRVSLPIMKRLIRLEEKEKHLVSRFYA